MDQNLQDEERKKYARNITGIVSTILISILSVSIINYNITPTTPRTPIQIMQNVLPAMTEPFTNADLLKRQPTLTKGITYISTHDNLLLKMDVAYDPSISNAPVMLVLHGYREVIPNNDIIIRLAKKGFFAIQTYKRGFGGSAGISDDSGRETQDFIDAIAYVKNQYAAFINRTNINVIGYSGGGGNTYALITKFPDYFNSAQVFFGMSDYGYNDAYGWWNNGGYNYRYLLEPRIGGTPTQNRAAYYARASSYAAGNNRYTKTNLFYDESEIVAPISHAQQFLKNITPATTNVSLLKSNNLTTTYEINDTFTTLQKPGWYYIGDSMLYNLDTINKKLLWNTNDSTRYNTLFKPFESLRKYNANTETLNAEFQISINNTKENGSVMIGFRNSEDREIKNFLGIILLTDKSGKITPYLRVDYNGKSFDYANRQLQPFAIKLLLNTDYKIRLDVTNGKVEASINDILGNLLEKQSLLKTTVLEQKEVDSFGISPYNDGKHGGISGTVTYIKILTPTRWKHAYPLEGDMIGESNITAENLFVNGILDGKNIAPVLEKKGKLFVPGYITTKQFYVGLGNGNDEAGIMTYDISGDASSLTTAKSFSIELLTGSAKTYIRIHGLRANTIYTVEHTNFTTNLQDKSTISSDTKGILWIKKTMEGNHQFKVYTN